MDVAIEAVGKAEEDCRLSELVAVREGQVKEAVGGVLGKPGAGVLGVAAVMGHVAGSSAF